MKKFTKTVVFFFFIAVVFIALTTVSVSAQEQTQVDPCQGKRVIGVEIDANGFQNRIEAESLAAAVMGKELFDPNSRYCLQATAGNSERKMVSRTKIRILERGQIPDSYKNQGIRIGVGIGVGEIMRRLPSKYRTSVRRVSREYTREPRITLYVVQVETETAMLTADTLQWEGSGTRIFSVRSTNVGNGRPKRIEILSGGTAGELAPYLSDYQLRTLEMRPEQLMQLLTLYDSIRPSNILQGGGVIARSQQE